MPDDLYEIPTREPGQQVTIPSVTRMHHGQHEDCFACKLSTMHFGGGDTPTHVVKGNPWKGNPVVDRIQELTGMEINTDIPRPPGAA